MLSINNAANSLGLGSKKYPKHFTPNASHSTILFIIIFCVNIKNRKINWKKKNIYLKSEVSKQEKKYENFEKF